ncbi:hypothetical protein EVAR_87586_1 [Eumeta japonica]|uniref:Uncharacterized protein n=1 Tax=Eumeta variegata TaxID=151549 RepID=A0A4C1WLP8_EUMVA|nr:hypothetical protein EVAR_87586_1 [Eumeta japonica]
MGTAELLRRRAVGGCARTRSPSLARRRRGGRARVPRADAGGRGRRACVPAGSRRGPASGEPPVAPPTRGYGVALGYGTATTDNRNGSYSRTALPT